MTESVAICQYLAGRHPQAGLEVTPDDSAYGDYLNFLHFGEATLTFPRTLVLRYGLLAAPAGGGGLKVAEREVALTQGVSPCRPWTCWAEPQALLVGSSA